MVSSKAKTVSEYLKSLPPDRRKEIEAVRKVVKRHLPRGFEEGIQYGMLGYYVPLSRYPDTYNGDALGIAALASQKQYMSLYLMGVYGDPKTKKWFEAAWKKSGKKLNMGKSCVRFKAADDLALEVVAEVIGRVTVEQYIAVYERARGKTAGRTTKKKTAKKKTAKKKTAKKKTAKKKTAKKKTAKKKTAKKKTAKKKTASRKR